MVAILSADEALGHLLAGTARGLDVRSEGEWADGFIPGFINGPILTNEERRLVGICYKNQGQNAAIQLGHTLVDPTRTQRIDLWLSATGSSRPVMITCWRGGLRSTIASQWLSEIRSDIWRINGGYKAMRKQLLKVVASCPPLLVLSGASGSGKTELLRGLPSQWVLDLEGLACHRGSSFGAFDGTIQPSQATFENKIGLSLMQSVPFINGLISKRTRRQGASDETVVGGTVRSERRSQHSHLTYDAVNNEILVEDESVMLGSCAIPRPVMAALRQSPVVLLEASRQERAEKILDEYIAQPLAAGMSPQKLEESLKLALLRLRKRLGGALTDDLSRILNEAFREPSPNLKIDCHLEWIKGLLAHYYDPLYEYGLTRWPRPILWRGPRKECEQWMRHRFA